MNNTFLTSDDLMFTSTLRTFIKSNKYGYYIDIFVPEKYVTKLMTMGASPKYFEEGVDSGFVLRCRLYSTSIILCNGCRLKYLSEDLATQQRVTPSNTRIKTLELNLYSSGSQGSKASNDAQCSILRATFKTTAQKLPKEFNQFVSE